MITLNFSSSERLHSSAACDKLHFQWEISGRNTCACRQPHQQCSPSASAAAASAQQHEQCTAAPALQHQQCHRSGSVSVRQLQYSACCEIVLHSGKGKISTAAALQSNVIAASSNYFSVSFLKLQQLLQLQRQQ
jgi:hypothetical protein